MTFRSLEKMPHLQKVYGIMRRDFHLQFECQSEATPTRNNRLRHFGWVIKGGNEYKSQRSHPVPLMGLFVYPRLSCFLPFVAILPLNYAPCLSISLTSLTFALWHRDPYRPVLNTNTKPYLFARKKGPRLYLLSKLNWVANVLRAFRAMVFIQAESLQDGNMFGAHFPSLPSLLELTYSFSSSSLTWHIQKLLCQTHEKQVIHSQQKSFGKKCFSCCNRYKVCALANIYQPAKPKENIIFTPTLS